MLTRDQFGLTFCHIKTRIMFLFKLLSVILTVPLVRTLSLVEEKIVNNGLSELLRAFSEQASVLTYESGQRKREALEASDDEKQMSSIFKPFDLYRANHYWTKRGHDAYTTPQPYNYDANRWVNPGSSTVHNNLNKNFKKKREISQFLGWDKTASRLKREAEREAEQNGVLAENQAKEALSDVSASLLETDVANSQNAHLQGNVGSFESQPIAALQGIAGSSERLPKVPLQVNDESTKRKHPGYRFHRKFSQS